MSSWFVHSAISLHPLATLGILLITAGLLLYLGGIVLAVLRVGRQYDGLLLQQQRLRVGAALMAAGRYWYWLIVALVGAGLVVYGK